MNDLKLTQAIATTAALVGYELPAIAVEGMVLKLRKYAEADVLAALDRCTEEVKGRLALKDVLDRIPGRVVPINADAAWELAMKLRVYDQGIPMALPDAILRAFPFELWPDDKIGARMAFKGAYEIALKEAGDDVWVTGAPGDGGLAKDELVAQSLAMGYITRGGAERWYAKRVANGRLTEGEAKAYLDGRTQKQLT